MASSAKREESNQDSSACKIDWLATYPIFKQDFKHAKAA
jgi:hypothetical protein